jgi:hypothetical protein
VLARTGRVAVRFLRLANIRTWVVKKLVEFLKRSPFVGILILCILVALVAPTIFHGSPLGLSVIEFSLVGAAISGTLALLLKPDGKQNNSKGQATNGYGEQPNKGKGQGSVSESMIDRDAKGSSDLVLRATAVGVIAFLTYALSQGAVPPAAGGEAAILRVCLRLVGAMALVAATGFACGALVGFLFGIPRSLQGKTVPSSFEATSQDQRGKPVDSKAAEPGSENKESTSTASTGTEKREPGYVSNTNLEEISDWLTKIIVGLGLINLKVIPIKLQAVALYFSDVTEVKIPPNVSLSLLIYFSVCGFFLAYLLTRLALPAAFSRADRAAVLDTLVRTASAVSTIESKMDYLVPQMDVIRAKDLIVSIDNAKEGEKQAFIQRAQELVNKLETHSKNFPTLRTLHIVLANLYYATGDLDHAVKVLQRFLDNLRERPESVNHFDASAALFNLACYYSNSSETAETDSDKNSKLAKAAAYLRECLEAAKKAGKPAYLASLGLAKTDPDLGALRKAGLVDLPDAEKN